MESEHGDMEFDGNTSRRRIHYLRSSHDRESYSGDNSSIDDYSRVSSSKTKSQSSDYKRKKLIHSSTKVYESETTEKVGPKQISDIDRSLASVENRQKRTRRTERQQSKRRLVINGTTVQPDIDSPPKTMNISNQENLLNELKERGWQQSSNTLEYSSDEGSEKNISRTGAFSVYKQAGEWWNKFPKTDYTYSPASSHRKEVSPGVILMPNMSRRSIHKEDLSIKSSRSSANMAAIQSRWFSQSATGSPQIPVKLKSWTVHNDSDIDEVDQAFKSSSTTTTRRSIITRIFTSIWTFFSVIFSSVVQSTSAISTSVVQSTSAIFQRNGASSSRSIITRPFTAGWAYVSSMFSSLVQSTSSIFQKNDVPVTPKRSDQALGNTWFSRLVSSYYLSVGYLLFADAWQWSRMFGSRTEVRSLNEEAPKPRRLKYLALLLIPLLLLTGVYVAQTHLLLYPSIISEIQDIIKYYLVIPSIPSLYIPYFPPLN